MVFRNNKIVHLHSLEDIVHLRHLSRTWAIELGFNLIAQTKLVTAVSELARNMLNFGGGGTVDVEVLEKKDYKGLRLSFKDHGPGIEDIEQAMKDGYTTGMGLGLGLGGSMRLVNEFIISSHVGEGTSVVITMWQ
jgi:serine/threonine-protein kinase RsbT